MGHRESVARGASCLLFPLSKRGNSFAVALGAHARRRRVSAAIRPRAPKRLAGRPFAAARSKEPNHSAPD